MSNPLNQYFRQPKLYIRLPSGTAYYKPNVVEFTENGEIGIMAMTAKDEASLKNPDGLLNGEAIANVIRSCVPSVKSPTYLLSNDIDAIFIAIRHASYGDKTEVNIICPACSEKNLFELSIDQTLGNMETLKETYSVTLSSGLEVIVRPFTYKETMNTIHMQFEQHKVVQALSTTGASEEERIKVISSSFDKMQSLNMSLITSAIVAVKVNDGQSIENKDHIFDFICNIERGDFESIEELVSKINKIGVPKEFAAECKTCHHTWEAEIDFNPVNFSIAS